MSRAMTDDLTRSSRASEDLEAPLLLRSMVTPPRSPSPEWMGEAKASTSRGLPLGRRATKCLIGTAYLTILLLLALVPREFTEWRDSRIVREEGTAQREVAWSPEGEALRAMVWEPMEVQPSLTLLLGNLNKSERRVREWILETRPSADSGVGIGMGAASPPQPIRPGPPASGSRGFPGKNQGPGKFEGGSFEKYGELLQEWQTGRRTSVCPTGLWQAKYTKMHAEMMSGEREAKLLEYICERIGDTGCGGLADRLLGIVSVFLWSILTGRAMSVLWFEPVPFDLIFDSPHIDWSRSEPMELSLTSHPIYGNETLVRLRQKITRHNPVGGEVDEFFKNAETTWARPDPPWIQMFINRGLAIRSFTYPNISTRLLELGFTPTNVYSCLVDYLVRPKPAVLQFITEYTSFFALPSIFSITVQIRTGDSSMESPESDRVNTVQRHMKYFTCAEQVARVRATPDQRIIYYLVSDSNTLKREALEAFPDRVVLSNAHSIHINIPLASANLASPVIDTLAVGWIITGTDFQILTDSSGYGRIPTWMRGKPGSTISLYNEHLYSSGPSAPVDCSLDTALVSFSQMANSWSLG